MVSAPSRYNDPELGPVLPRWGQPLSFDAENGPVQVATVFGDVEVQAWDEPMVSLSSPADVALYLRGRGLSEGHARPRRTLRDSFDSDETRDARLGTKMMPLLATLEGGVLRGRQVTTLAKVNELKPFSVGSNSQVNSFVVPAAYL